MARATVVDPESGLPRRKTWYGATEAEARIRMNEALAEYRRGAPVGVGREPTLRAWSTEWLAGLQLRPKTVLRYRQALAHALPVLGDRPLSRITPTAVSGLIRQLHRDGRKTRTANRVRDVLRNCLNEAVRQGKLTRNAAELARPLPEHDVEERKILPLEDVARFLDLAAGDPDGALWVLALATGGRLGEAQGLMWDDIDTETGTARIEREIQWVEGRWIIQPPKSRRSRRTVGLPAAAVEALNRERSRQAEMQAISPTPWPETWAGYCFLTDRGVPRNPSVVTHRMKRALRDAGLEAINFHALRHSAGSYLVGAHVPVAEVSKALGHSRVSTTVDFYAHAVDKTGISAAVMVRVLAGSGRRISGQRSGETSQDRSGETSK